MKRKAERNSILATFSTLGWPMILGLATCSGFYVLILRGPWTNETVDRYFASHPVSYCATAMFFVGMAALAIKLCDVAAQQLWISRLTLDLEDDAEVDVRGVPALLDRLDQCPASMQHTYLARRLRDALQWVLRRSSAAGLDDELKYLADNDAARQHESYALVRIIIWATPMLGFLGTVIGITQALGDLGSHSDLLATDPKQAMQGLLSGLYVAFDTTALALTLSIILMFVQFLVDRMETQLLDEVDRRASDELASCIVEADAGEPHLAAVRRMGVAVIQTAEQLARQQTQHWERVIDGANEKWSQLLQSSGDQVRDALAVTLEQSVYRLSEQLARSQQEIDERLSLRWEQWQTALSDNARLLHAQQAELVRQGEVMTRVLQATGQVANLEQTLNDNLRTLSGAQHFEETVLSLSAAIQLLSARLSQAQGNSVRLESAENQGRAA